MQPGCESAAAAPGHNRWRSGSITGFWQTLAADLLRYTGEDVPPWSPQFFRRLVAAAYVHPGAIAVAVYRYGQWAARCRMPIVRQIANLYYYYWFNWVRTRLQIELPRDARIGPGLCIYHYGGILVNSQIEAGRNLTLTQGVLIGQADSGIPRLGDDIAFGVGARVIGGVTVGNRVVIGAGAVVTKSFPDDTVIAGVPARVIRFRSSTGACSEDVDQHEEG